MTATAARLDPRTTLARPDLAEQALEGLVRARAFRAAVPMHGAVPVADITADPDLASARIDQLLHGEAFDVLERRDGRLFGRARRDGVVGWMTMSDLADGVPLATHRVGGVDAALPMNALVVIPEGASEAGFAPIGSFAADPLDVAERLLGTPHAPGARSSIATDCAGLIQQALYACGRSGPRYADQQAELGHAVTRADARRGDLVIWLHPIGGPGWTGHSAFLQDADTVLHATGHHGAVVTEPLSEADARYRADGFSEPVFRCL